MSLLCVKTHDLSWQDRTINVELMIAPHKSQLLFNKHKGLKTKYEQVSHNLDREKDSYIRSYKTDQRLMERKKDVYAKRRNDIIQKRALTDYLGRRRSSLPANVFAQEIDSMFITAIPARNTQSAGPNFKFPPGSPPKTAPARVHSPVRTKLEQLPVTPDMRLVSACSTARSATPGKPFLQRDKSVRFQRINQNDSDGDNKSISNHVCEHIHSRITFNVPIEDRIKHFLDKQHDFNTNPAPLMLPRLSQDFTDSKKPLIRKSTMEHLNLTNLENAFDEFCTDESNEGLEKLIKYATKMKASARNARELMVG